MTIHTKLKIAREKKNLTQQQVSDVIGITRQAISQWENGKSTPDLETLSILCKLYEISPSSILSEYPEDLPKTNNTSANKDQVLETLGISLILILMSQFAFIGILASIVVLIWMLKTKRKSVLIYLLCLFCFCISIYNSFVVIEHIFLDMSTSSITPIN